MGRGCPDKNLHLVVRIKEESAAYVSNVLNGELLQYFHLHLVICNGLI